METQNTQLPSNRRYIIHAHKCASYAFLETLEVHPIEDDRALAFRDVSPQVEGYKCSWEIAPIAPCFVSRSKVALTLSASTAKGWSSVFAMWSRQAFLWRVSFPWKKNSTRCFGTLMKHEVYFYITVCYVTTQYITILYGSIRHAPKEWPKHGSRHWLTPRLQLQGSHHVPPIPSRHIQKTHGQRCRHRCMFWLFQKCGMVRCPAWLDEKWTMKMNNENNNE